MPSFGQSCTWPDGSLSFTACHRKSPVFSSKHMSTPLSSGFPPLSMSRLFRGWPLFVPTKILPLATVGPP